MATIPDIWLCTCCISSFDAGRPAEQLAFVGCPRCQSPRIYWCPAAAYHLAAGGSLPGAFAIAELERQRMHACLYRHYRGHVSLLELALNLASDEKLILIHPDSMYRHLRLCPKHLLQCVN